MTFETIGKDDSTERQLGVTPKGQTGIFTGSASADRARELTAGMVSGFVCKILEYPLDSLKVLMQTHGSKFNGPLDLFMKTKEKYGLMSLYRGLTSPLIGAMVENAVIFAAYGHAKKLAGVDETSATPENPVPLYKYALSGAYAGVASAFVLTPVELVKCRIQVQQAGDSSGFRGPIAVIQDILKEDGFRGLYRGNVACLYREIPGNFAWFGVYEAALRGFQNHFGYERRSDVPLPYCALSGSIAGVAYWTFPYPFDTAKSKQQSDPKYFNRPVLEVLRSVGKEEGVKGLYRGLGVTYMRAIPSHAIIFLVFEGVNNYLKIIG